MINSTQLREQVIRPVLQDMGYHSEAAENLLVMIAAHESKMGTYIKQIKGPARGIYQMEPATDKDIWTTYLHGRESLRVRVAKYKSGGSPEQDLTANLLYQTAMARAFFLRFKEPIPAANDLQGLAEYAKKYWNTNAGKATPADYLTAYQPHH